MVSGVVESPALSRRFLRLALLPGLLLLALCAPAGASEFWITDGPDGETASTSATFVFEAPGASSYGCSLDGAEPAACTSPQQYADLAEGWHSFELGPFDDRGAPFAEVEIYEWYVDLTPPETTITSAPATVSGPSATFAFAADEDGTFECSLDGQAFAACSSPAAYTGFADGAHTFAVRAVDGVGHPDTTPAARSWTVDATPPTTQLLSFTASAATRTATVTFASGEGGVMFQCSVTGGPAVPCTSPHTWRDLPAGSLLFTVRARDAVGNLGPRAIRTWRLDLLNLDDDGYRAPQDCRDDDPGINPGARDVLADGIDQNCDGFDGPPPVRGAIVARWRPGRQTTKAVRLLVTGLYRGARVSIGCRGRGCPLRARTRRPPMPDNPLALGIVDLRRLLRDRPLRPGSTLTVRIEQRNMTTKLAVFRIRKGRPPAGGELRCLPAGAATPVACPASSY